MSAEKLGRAIREAMEADRENAFQFEKALTFANSTPPAMSADHIGDAQGWRDIATAPRDGSAFMVWWPHWYHFPLTAYVKDYRLRLSDSTQPAEPWEFGTGDGPTHWQPLPAPPYAHPAPIKTSADTGELRERVAREIRDWPFPINQHEGCLELADAILDLIQSERVG